MNVGVVPVYMDELSLSRFIEEYLDYFVDYLCKQEHILFERHASPDDASSSAKILSDLIKLLEVDRVSFKSYNTLIAMIIHPDKAKINKVLLRNFY